MENLSKKRIHIIIATIISAAAFSMISYANSAPVFITSGDSSRGVIPREEIPLIVEKEMLTFDIPNLEAEGMQYDINEAINHSGTVTAQYFFKNPTKESITTRLAFAQGVERLNSSCDIRVNEIPLETRARYTYAAENESFFGPEDVKKIKDDYIEDDFFDPYMTVSRFKFTFNGISENENAYFEYEIPDEKNTRIIIPCRRNQSGEYSRKVENGDVINVYVIGNTENVRISWNINLPHEEIMEFLPEENGKESLIKLAVKSMRDKKDIGDIDSYNVMIEGMNASTSFGIISLYLSEEVPETNMWIEYEFTIGPGEEAINTVKAVLAPEFYNYRKHPEFTYNYLLSPAQCWKKFGSLDVIINTPHELYGNSKDDFIKTETGYERHYDSLPNGELSFCLISGNDSSEMAGQGGTVLALVLVVVLFIVAVVIVIGLVMAVILIIVNSRKNKKK